MESGEVIVVESYTQVNQFIDKFQLAEFKDLPITINKTEKLTPVYSLHFEEYDVDIELEPLTFKFNIIVSEFEKDNNIRKLTITVREEIFKEELQGCINHLQRKRNLQYAIEQLVHFLTLFRQRAKMIEFFLQAAPDCLNMDYKNERGYVVQCFDPHTKDVYFRVKWKVWWNCRNFVSFDYINFAINKSYAEFHANVRTIMEDLLVPSFDYSVKLANWSKVFEFLKQTISINLLSTTLRNLCLGPTDFHGDNFEILTAPIEISDSDSEDEVCVIDPGYSNNNNIFVID